MIVSLKKIWKYETHCQKHAFLTLYITDQNLVNGLLGLQSGIYTPQKSEYGIYRQPGDILTFV